MIDFINKVAIVTGAARGIGRAYAEDLARAGASVAICDILDAGLEVAESLRSEGLSARFVKVDVASKTSTMEMAQIVADEFGGVDILINNAAIWGGLDRQPAEEIDPSRWDEVYGVNVKGMWLSSIAVAPFMRLRGGGVIVNQSSIGAYLAGPLTAHYSSSKAAVNGLTKVLAKAFADDGIRVNAIAPGGIATAATLEKSSLEQFDLTVARQCIKRRGQPSDLLGPLRFLASDASSFMSGQILIVDGGLEMRG